MIVRVYDSVTDTYFKSEVYASVGIGIFEKKLVKNGDYFKFYDCVDRESKTSPLKRFIDIISISPLSDWIRVEEIEFAGFGWLYDDKETLTKLLNGESVPVHGSIFEDKLINEREVGWNYIDTQEDIDFLMLEVYGFHDAVIETIGYTGSDYVKTDGGTWRDDIPKATFILDIQGFAMLEMVFENVTAINIRPSSYIYGAALYINDCTVYFSDEYVPTPDTSCTGTWITSYGMKWR